jgi:hypothetical protein
MFHASQCTKFPPGASGSITIIARHFESVWFTSITEIAGDLSSPSQVYAEGRFSIAIFTFRLSIAITLWQLMNGRRGILKFVRQGYRKRKPVKSGIAVNGSGVHPASGKGLETEIIPRHTACRLYRQEFLLPDKRRPKEVIREITEKELREGAGGGLCRAAPVL